jgi:hypothetical protein
MLIQRNNDDERGDRIDGLVNEHPTDTARTAPRHRSTSAPPDQPKPGWRSFTRDCAPGDPHLFQVRGRGRTDHRAIDRHAP